MDYTLPPEHLLRSPKGSVRWTTNLSTRPRGAPLSHVKLIGLALELTGQEENIRGGSAIAPRKKVSSWTSLVELRGDVVSESQENGSVG